MRMISAFCWKFNSSTNLVFELIIEKNFYSQTRLVGLTYMIHTKLFTLAAVLEQGRWHSLALVI